jgi:hypothetical protein
MVAVQRANDPRLLERRQPASGVQLAHVHRGLDHVQRDHDGA